MKYIIDLHYLYDLNKFGAIIMSEYLRGSVP